MLKQVFLPWRIGRWPVFLSEEPSLCVRVRKPAKGTLSPACSQAALSGQVRSWTSDSLVALAGADSAGVLRLFVYNVCTSQPTVKWSSLAEELTVRASFSESFIF